MARTGYPEDKSSLSLLLLRLPVRMPREATQNQDQRLAIEQKDTKETLIESSISPIIEVQ